MIETIRWSGDWTGHLELIDQTLLPGRLEYLACRDAATVWNAIQRLQVRGAPAIGIAAAYGVVLEIARGQPPTAPGAADLQREVHNVCDYLEASRPTAVNLAWALARMRRAADDLHAETKAPRRDDLCRRLWREARAIHEDDRAMCRAIGMHGAALLENVDRVLTHCNAGGLATAEYGTALSVIFTAQDQGHLMHVYVDETRPLWQGARLTAWELHQRGIPATLICDSMAALVMRQGQVQAVLTGADRIAANGDAANKIGTYGLAVLAAAHAIPLYIAAPSSTFDLSIADGSQIPIEQRAAEEITRPFGQLVAPDGVAVYNPAFDVTPARYIRAIITERGPIEPVTSARIADVLGVI